MRITKKIENNFYVLTKENEIYGEENGIRLVQIVGEYEDIEDELGIGLVTLIRALKNGIYVNNEHTYKGLDEEQNDDIQLFECRLLDGIKGLGIIHTSMFKGREVVRDYLFKDYGKTWALTKEEIKYE